MLKEYYRTRGWDEKGEPKKQKLEELGLANLL
jgi:aldehyde:ferredoxin oxidoreductase